MRANIHILINSRSLKPLVSISCFLWITLLVGCIDEIDLSDSESGEGKMVIQGRLVKSCPSFISVQVSRSLDFKSRELPPPVSGAVISLVDDQGNEAFVPETEDGLYQLVLDDSASFPVQTGQRYRISVVISETEQYQSTLETLSPVPEPDSVSIELIERDELDHNNTRLSKKYVQFFIHTPLTVENQSDRAILRWDFEAIYQVTEIFIPGPGPGPQTCYISRDLGLEKIAAFNGNESSTERLDHFMIVEDLAEARFGLGYLLRIKQTSLSRAAFQYFNQVNQAVSLSGGLFEATPGEILGNISNTQDPREEVFGYFHASEEIQITRFVKPSEVGFPEEFCDLTQNAMENVCTDCTLIPFSTKELPEGWEF